jgi:hypothetical protein
VEHEDASVQGDTVIARVPPNVAVQPGQMVEIELDRERLQFFDPVSGVSLLRGN